MGRKPTWKSAYIINHDHVLHLRSVASHHKPWQKYTITIGQGNIDTNLPWSELRALFRSAWVPFPKEWVTSEFSIEEQYADELKEDHP